jgi:4-diphosphocytidyl-2-C-methyl-D-erythritol kinase
VKSVGWPAPAKVNLFLHVMARRPDGYHELQTAFQLLDLSDSIDFELRSDGVLVRTAGPIEILPEDDLVLRAARLLRRQADPRCGANIALHKRIPAAGGLGGGSSDAATVLVALNLLWDIGLDEGELARLGLALGADVPVFVRGRSAWAEGVGEVLTPIELPRRWFAIVRPAVEVSTASVFQAPELTRNSPRITIIGFLQAGGRNDCEPVVAGRYPEVRRALDWLAARAGEARLTGTGSCVFAALGSRAEAEASLEDLPEGWTGLVAAGIDRSPLLDRVEVERAGRRGLG